MRKHLAVADEREIIVHYEADTIPCRLILPHGIRRWYLDVAAPDELAGRPWILRWNRFVKGLRQGDTVLRHVSLFSADRLDAGLLQAVEESLRFIEHGSRIGHA